MAQIGTLALSFLAGISAFCGCARSDDRGADTRDSGATSGNVEDGAGGDGGDDSALPTRVACDPFAPHMQPITLGALIGAGQDSDGTVYVAATDELSDEARVFVASGPQLVRQRVAGSSRGSTSSSFSVTDHEPAFFLLIEGAYPDSVRMAVAENFDDEVREPVFDDGEELAIIAEPTIRAMTLRNLPGNVSFEHGYRYADGRLLVVTRPEDDWSYEDFRVFFGPAEHVAERRLIQAARGNDTYIDFDVDGVEVEVIFPQRFVEDASTDAGSPSLTPGTQGQGAAPLDAPPSDASYECFSER